MPYRNKERQSSTGLRCQMPHCRCWRHVPLCRCPLFHASTLSVTNMPLVPLGKSRDPQDNVEFGRQGVLRTVDGSSDGPGLRDLFVNHVTPRIMMNLPARGFCVQWMAAVTVLVCGISKEFAVPVSTTHCQVC
jgi:hypothetical protein